MKTKEVIKRRTIMEYFLSGYLGAANLSGCKARLGKTIATTQRQLALQIKVFFDSLRRNLRHMPSLKESMLEIYSKLRKYILQNRLGVSVNGRTKWQRRWHRTSKRKESGETDKGKFGNKAFS